MTLEKVTRPFLRFWDSSEQQWEPLSARVEKAWGGGECSQESRPNDCSYCCQGWKYDKYKKKKKMLKEPEEENQHNLAKEILNVFFTSCLNKKQKQPIG